MISTFQLNNSEFKPTSIPWIAFGTGTALKGRDAASAVKLAIEGGFTHLDGAQVYDNEESLGRGIAAAMDLNERPRSELFITTKLGKLGVKETGEQETVEQSLRASLNKLQLTYVDLFLIHTPLDHPDRLEEVWKEMETVQELSLTK